MGLAQEVEVSTGKKSTAKVYRISEEGQKLIYDAMRYNARAAIARGEGEWTQPPSSGQLRLDTPVDAPTSAQNEVGEAGEAPPYHRRPRWRIGSAVEIAPEPSNSPDVKCEVARCPALPLGRRLVEQLALVLRENRSGVGPWRLAAEHRQP